MTDRLILRDLVQSDLADLCALQSDPEAMRYVGAGGARTTAQTQGSLDRLIEHGRLHGYSLWATVIAATGEMIGVTGLVLVEGVGPDVELVYELARPYWGKGYATEAARASLAAGFERFGLERIVALAYPENGPSIRIMEKLGMVEDGSIEAYEHRLVRYAADRRAPVSSP